MKRVLLVLLIVAGVFLFVSCDFFDDSDGGQAFSSIDLSNSEGVFMMQSLGSKAGRSTGSEQQDLYKIKKNDNLEQVSLLDASGKPVDTWGKPTSIIRINEDFFVLRLGWIGTYCPPVLLASVKEGKLICLNHEGRYNHSEMSCYLPYDASSLSAEGFIYATDEYIYWVAPHMRDRDNMLDGTLLRRYDKDNGEISVEWYSTDDRGYSLSAGRTSDGKDAMMLYLNRFTYSGASRYPENGIDGYLKVGNEKKAIPYGNSDTELNTVDSTQRTILFFNDSFYVITGNGPVKQVEWGTGDMATVSAVDTSATGLQNFSGYKDYVKASDTAMLYAENGTVILFSVDGSGETVIESVDTSMSAIIEVQGEGSDYYICGKDQDSGAVVIRRFEPGSGEFTTVASTSEFSVISFIKKGDSFFFTGRNDSGKYITGSIDSNEFEQSGSEYDQELSYLIKINNYSY